MTSVLDPMTRTAEEWRQEARDARKRSFDSFERCDTDGYLSQWAATQMGQRYDLLATIAEEGGFWFMEVADLDGNLLDARYVETRYGWSWVWDDADGNAVWFRESNARKGERRKAAHAKKGVMLVRVKREAVMFSDGNVKPKRGAEALAVEEIGYEDY